ncbi:MULTISPECIES: NahK/ErcS family hybrid sensor histidine kinase/response regulator [unclassified Pseudomonas]|jgi:PAS domain S-box-containing protein|uniref:PAS domain-containing hybrid sensor histidine kinase/response regulator n=1 Tax=unclassified Pseudomonas TaxID=196821 RepID=UPI002447158A|nr:MULTISPECIES: NahK/ErcS family hybrid sensor histidine kinase/response regulator [unclassified Pseudomonas]MDG9928811.1 ATP-binding protein [Pseudomonas sp. GD04042]MDH0481880.1 ATP-binding protein [Pseudomonas sp. GD04015]MDH0603252.1 ATP-binding protein [Pseudomonas sp. GD03869]
MARPSEDPQKALAGLLGLGSQSQRKSHYPELMARLEELEAERNRYKWLFENAVHGVFRASLTQGLMAANPALARMLGYAEPREVLWSLSDLARELFVGGAEELLSIRDALQARGGLYGYETELRRRDGSRITVIMNLLLKPDEPGVFEGFVADITERKLAQLRLQQLNDELELRVAARTEELREARDAAQEANHSKDRFLAAASHDLLQPLNAARLLIATLAERALPSAERQLVERTQQALDGAEELLGDLLDISRLDQAAVRADPADHDLADLFAPLASEFQPVAEAAGLRLRTRLPKLAVRTDLHLASRILRNLLSNACRYTGQGGVLLAARRRGERVRIEVWDSGRGIPEEQLEAIFQEFSQLEPGRGVGLGLAIVERIAQLLDSPVQVRSRLGRGSCFAFELPLAPMPRRAVAKAPQVQLGDPLPGHRLLVVDNEQSILDSMAALLGQWGCEVLTARDLNQALAVLDGKAPDVLLIDYHLDNGVIGCEVVEALRARFDPQLPVVMITADRSEQCQSAAQRKAIPLLNKPLKPGKLRAVLSQVLG